MAAKPILCVGSVALDSIQTPFGDLNDGLGGSAMYFAYSAGQLAPVRVVAAVGEDFPKKHLSFLKKQKNIDLGGLEVVKGGKTFRWHGKYGDNLNEAITLRTDLNVLETFDPKVPDEWKDTPIVFLANIDPELQIKVLDQIEKPKLVCADSMNLWIDIKLDRLKELMRRLDVLTINESEALMITEDLNLVTAARKILKMGPKRLVVKRGEYGVTMFWKDKFFAMPAYPLEEVKDPTGAGDTFAGGFVGELAGARKIDDAAFRKAVVRGSTHASFVVEGFSLDAMKKADKSRRDKRYKDFLSFTKI